MTLAKSITNEDFDLALTLIQEGQKDEIEQELKQVYFFQNMHNYGQHLKIVAALLEIELLEPDIFLYTHIEHSIFGQVIRIYSKKDEISEENYADLVSVLKLAENIDEPVRGKNLMNFAIASNVHIRILDALIEAGCDVNFCDDLNRNYLHIVAEKPATRSVDPRNPEKDHIDEYVEYFIEKGVDINAIDNLGNTPLLRVVTTRQLTPNERVKLFLEHGADPMVANKKGITAIQQAFDNSRIELCEYLMEYGATVNSEILDSNHQDSIYRFLKTDYPRFGKDIQFKLKLIIDAGFDPFQTISSKNNIEETPIDIILKKDADYLEFILENMDIDVNTIDKDGNTLLHKLCGLDCFLDSNKQKELYKKAKILVKAGADVHAQNNEEKTPRELATPDNRKVTVVKYLLGLE